MRIHIRVAMPGEMLANGKYAPAFAPTAVCHHLFRHPLRVLAKGAYVYHLSLIHIYPIPLSLVTYLYVNLLYPILFFLTKA